MSVFSAFLRMFLVCFCVVLFFLSAAFCLFICLSCSCMDHVAWIKLIDWLIDILSGKRRTKLFWNLHPKPESISELKFALEKIWDNFPPVQLKKLSRVLQIVWQEYVNGDGQHSKHLSLLKSVCTYSVCAVLNRWDNFFDSVSSSVILSIM